MDELRNGSRRCRDSFTFDVFVVLFTCAPPPTSPFSSSQDPTDRSIKTHKSRLLTIAHEFAHILGMSSYDFPYYYSHATGLPRTPRDEWGRPPEVESLCVDGARRLVPVASESTLRSATTSNGYVAYEIVTETVRNVVRNQFDCRRVDGARLEVGSLRFVRFIRFRLGFVSRVLLRSCAPSVR